MNWLAHQALAAPAGHWDELRGLTSSAGLVTSDAQAQMSTAWQSFIQHLGAEGLNGLNTRMGNLQRQVRDNGITYNVYAAADQPQRPWSLDLFPLMVPQANWQQIQAGVLQRMQLLERIMADAYGPQNLVLSGQLPAALIQGHPAYLPAMHGVPPVGGRYLSLAAFDLARGPDGCWWLLSQRTQAPSGLGYLLENRLIVSRLFPQAFEGFPVQRLAETYRTLIDGIKARSPAGASAHIALLTPGPYNETYFEHAYLARYLGLSLVQGNDLTVRDEKLYLKTLQGLQPVHGLLKRVDDDWLDPLELRAESTLGVPGLLQAVRSGNVLVANTPGSGFLESNALLGFMPALARTLLDEELQLPAIPSWWCGEAAALQDVLPRISGCVIKPTYPYNTDRHSFEPVLGHQLSRQEQDEWAGRILRDPDAYTLQSWLPLSHQPTWQTPPGGQARIESRPVVLRVFAVADAQGDWQVLPGGLARLGTREGIASMQRGGSSADVWVQAAATKPEAARAQDTLSPETANPREAAEVSAATPAESPQPSAQVLAQRQRLVTSRAAENLFWMGRYTERRLKPTLVASDNSQDTVEVQALLGETSQMLAALTGAQTDRMTRDDGWRLLSIGRHIERLEFLSSALGEAVQGGLIGEQSGFDAVLDLFDSTISFHAQYQQSRTPQALMDLLVTNPDNPRALGWVAHTLRSRLLRMGSLADGATVPLAGWVPRLVDLTPEALWPLNCAPDAHFTGSAQALPLHAALEHCQSAARQVSDQLCALFFTHSGDARFSFGV
jgi:uncharacterized circularly permuted ATP-grasp superfamily protein/uncharacterized alpha-E superfamily protein